MSVHPPPHTFSPLSAAVAAASGVGSSSGLEGALSSSARCSDLWVDDTQAPLRAPHTHWRSAQKVKCPPPPPPGPSHAKHRYT